jgi:hypothetical protein
MTFFPVFTMFLRFGRNNSRQFGPVQRQRLARRYATGETPKKLRKYREKWLWSAKPVASAISASDAVEFASSRQAYSMRSFLTYSPIVSR